MNIGGFLRRNGVGIVLLGSFSGCSGLILYPIYQHTITSARRSSCQSNLHDLLLASYVYCQDYNGRYLPISNSQGMGWSQIIQRSGVPLSFSCPAGSESSFSPSSDYFFNARFAGRKADSVRDPMNTIVFGDGPDNGPANSHYWELPNDGDNPDSPLRRHGSGSNYGFADGHAKFESPEGLNEWMEYGAGRQEWHIKFSPDESDSRPKVRQKLASPTPNAQTKRLHDLVHAARSFEKQN